MSGIKVYPIAPVIDARNDLKKRSQSYMPNDKKLVNKIKITFLETLIEAQTRGNYI